MRRLWILGLGTAVVVAGIGVLVVRSGGSEPVERGAPAQVLAVKEAVPHLLGGSCRLGTIPLTESMGGIELDLLIDEARRQTPAQVREIYASTVAAEMTETVLQMLDSQRMQFVPGIGDCTFAADSWSVVEVTGDTATVEVIGTYRKRVTNNVASDIDDPSFLTDEHVPMVVHLRQENGRWLIESATSTRPVQN